MTLNCKNHMADSAFTKFRCQYFTSHSKMRKSLVEDTVLKQNKMSDMNDKSATVNETVRVTFLRIAVVECRGPHPFHFNLVQVKFSAHAKVIDDAVLCKLIFHWSTKKKM